MKQKPPEDHSLRVQLDKDEVLLAGQQLAMAEQALDQLENELKAVTKGFKDKIDVVKSEVKRLAADVTNESSVRTVPCHWTVEERGKGQKAWKHVLRRSDTGAIISETNVTAADRQEDLFPSSDESDAN